MQQNENILNTRNILVILSYDGSKYHGWQVQKNALTVQEVFQNALEKIINQNDDKLTINAKTSNTFLLIQRLLSFGSNCKIISPENFKNEFVTLLKDMKAGYCCD